ncbi:MoaD/ThiS family protein [Nesterenkonia sandarakina]|uniref:Molybdopterin converting factor small subunit n=1 Tax=Nesterenkonia sandarakina TaxID=272918 RepID=A0A7Z0J3P4_9MICC|nr:MoaD/ThiS family protein [Nesterenkonia sandarakina]NYJ17211.1 molybdopterin converting factor small subunit [Nesterenkonia sandarakina]
MTETSPPPSHAPIPADSPAGSPATSPAASPTSISVRFFAAAAEAAGAEQLQLEVPAQGVGVVDLLADLPRLVRQQRPLPQHPAHDDAASPSLERVCARSSFLVNGVRARPETTRVHPGDQLDVLPPFAGG